MKINFYRNIFTFFLLICTQVLWAQVNADKWRAGSANILADSIYTLSCFVSGPDDAWTQNEKKDMADKLNSATQWLKEQALKYEINLYFQNGYYGSKEDIKLPVIERGTASGNERVDWVSLVLKAIGYKSNLDLYDWVLKHTNCRNLQVIMFVKGIGNGYALPYSNVMDKELYFVEGAILYEKYLDGRELAFSSIVHEIIHLYGGWDLYKTFDQSQDREDKARKEFPNSIMLRTSYDINELDIDEINAWLIGWNSNPKAWYDWYRPKSAR